MLPENVKNPARFRRPERLASLRVPEVIERVVSLQMSAALDVGTGTGVWAEALAKAGIPTVYALDHAAAMLDEVRRQAPAVVPIQAEADQTGLEDASVDLVFAGFVLHETPDPAAALREWRRVARRRVAVIEWRKSEGDKGSPGHRRFRLDQVTRMGNEAGLGEPGVWDAEEWLLYRWELG